MIHTHHLDGTSTLSYYKGLFPQYDGNVVLRLIKREDKFLQSQGEMIFENCDKAISVFSLDSKMFAIMIPLGSENDPEANIYHNNNQ